ncbi:single-stranded DNA-binding protein [Pseudomonas syringae]|uniref:single-stranded DNA-binding protein n=1 Tax=Pseudomonas syringae TaxID=317 RepID=UPI001F97A69C|nr:single-stranded DNA-binding protein [Pseudomonas syringae]MCF5382473.1 single-stranded DNA-binding protein [Pseudomonas syringae]MCF5419360.1 single-stranded DNA-binding protein [Pseudomonas syringae]MCF5455040.1 single-stranded DNA-binding protein [Pseudomonas syringae]MCF5460482.1 single-stranded DNA-binding protein [Pseudomonas syringae]
MLRGVCKVFLVGKAGEEGVVRYTAGGTPVLRISLANDSSRSKVNGGAPKPDWHKVVIVGPQAEDKQNAVLKGSTCYVEGTLRTREYVSRGASRRVTELVVDGEGTFAVYHDLSQAERMGAPQSTPQEPYLPTERAVQPLRRQQTSPPAAQPVKIGDTQPDDEILSFDGLTLQDYSDPFD